MKSTKFQKFPSVMVMDFLQILIECCTRKPTLELFFLKVEIYGFQMKLVPSKSEDTHIEKKGSENGLHPMRGGKNDPLHQTSVACTQDMSMPMVTLVCALALKNMTISYFKLG